MYESMTTYRSRTLATRAFHAHSKFFSRHSKISQFINALFNSHKCLGRYFAVEVFLRFVIIICIPGKRFLRIYSAVDDPPSNSFASAVMIHVTRRVASKVLGGARLSSGPVIASSLLPVASA